MKAPRFATGASFAEESCQRTRICDISKTYVLQNYDDKRLLFLKLSAYLCKY